MPLPGHTRSSYQRDHLLQTPDTFVRVPLPGMTGATAIVHAGPAIGAKFAEYTVELAPGGSFTTTPSQAFLYVIEGEISVGTGRQLLQTKEFLYLPPDQASLVSAGDTSAGSRNREAILTAGFACPRAVPGQ